MQGIRLKTILNVFFGFWNQPYDFPLPPQKKSKNVPLLDEIPLKRIFWLLEPALRFLPCIFHIFICKLQICRNFGANLPFCGKFAVFSQKRQICYKLLISNLPQICKFAANLMQICSKYAANLRLANLPHFCKFAANLIQICCKFDANLLFANLPRICKFAANLMQITNLQIWCKFAANLHQM